MVAFHKLPYASQRLQPQALMSMWQQPADHALRGSLPRTWQYHKEELKPWYECNLHFGHDRCTWDRSTTDEAPISCSRASRQPAFRRVICVPALSGCCWGTLSLLCRQACSRYANSHISTTRCHWHVLVIRHTMCMSCCCMQQLSKCKLISIFAAKTHIATPQTLCAEKQSR